jgi:lysine 2,3-aminomutase
MLSIKPMPIHEIKNIQQLEKLTGKKIQKTAIKSIKKILETMPVRLTDHLLKLSKKSKAIAAQFIPNINELKKNGFEKPWVGIMGTGIHGLERMYIDRCIILPFNQCPAYCRFCFRKFYERKKATPMPYENIDKALLYIKKDKRLKGVLITGGDPLLDLKRLEYILKNLRKIEHVQDIRIATRSLMFDPQRITDSFVKMVGKYHNFEKMKPVEIATHFNHPDEITPQAIKAITKLTKSSMKVYNQTVLLKGINDDPKILADLFRKLRLLGVEIYCLYHCDPVKGVEHFRTSIKKGIEIKKYFRGGTATGRINPAYIVDTQIGKVEIGVDGYIEKKEGKYVWIKTPYKLSTYKSVSPNFKLPEGQCKIDKQGYISIKYLDGTD